jgi:hypothetical protein
MIRRIVPPTLVLLALAWGCGAFGSSSDPVADAGAADAAVGDAGEHIDATAVDAGGDVDVDGSSGCTTLFNDEFNGTELGGEWIIAGRTPTVANGEALLLDKGETTQTSAIWHRARSQQAAQLEIRVELRIAPIDDGTTADGMAIAWAPAKSGDDAGNFLRTAGGVGQDLGICPESLSSDFLNGALALGLETYQPLGGGRRLDLIDSTVKQNCGQRLQSATISSTMASVVALRGLDTSGNLGGPFTAKMPRAMDVEWVGFTASNGSNSSRQSIAHVRVLTCP